MELKQNEIIQVLRRRVQLNQGDFGARAFSTSFESGRTKVKNLELGRQVPTRDDLEKMAHVLGVPVSELIPTEAAEAAGAAFPGDGDGLQVGRELLEAFPGLEDYLGMLDKAVKVDDRELIRYIAGKIAHLLQEEGSQNAEARRM